LIQRGVIIVDADHPIPASQQAVCQKEQQRRHAEAGGELAGCHAQHQQDGNR
ncbi:MAG: hypothetical protein HY835_10600, partial [Anaerolineae bacterium]|nr:hypothetical protein [Anaerolineae bacterium]